MLRKIVLSILFTSMFSMANGQAAYMDEVYEDAVESDSDGASGIISLVIFFGIVWFISKIYDYHKEAKQRNEEIKREREISTKVATTIIQKHQDISKYQNKESWQKGFANATYDISHNRVKSLAGRTVDDLIQEYRTLCEKGHLIQAESIMEQIGYFQKLEYNQKQIETEKNTKVQSISKPATQQAKPAEELKPFETDEYILSPDKKTLQKGKDVEIIHIPIGVERIKDKAFESLKHIKEVIVPEGVKEIGAWAFNFSSIEKIVIPSTVEKIGENAFYFCENLKEVVIKDGVKRLGVGMFSSCDLLENVSLPSTLTSIPDSCFDGCISLEEIKIPENVTYIGDAAFANCACMAAIDIPESVTDIGIEAFRGCSELKSVVIPQKVVGLSDRLFYDDYQLETVVLPNNLTCIMSDVFYQCSHLRIKLPPSVSFIGKDAFMSCNELHMEVPKGKKDWVESAEKNVKGHVTEYEYDEEYIPSKENEKRTQFFLEVHKEKNRRRSDELMESLGFSTSPDDDYLMLDDSLDDYDNDYYDDDFD